MASSCHRSYLWIDNAEMGKIVEVNGERYFSFSLVETTDVDKVKVNGGEWLRADDSTLCSCNLPYNRHKMLDRYPWLVKLCDGSLVKL